MWSSIVSWALNFSLKGKVAAGVAALVTVAVVAYLGWVTTSMWFYKAETVRLQEELSACKDAKTILEGNVTILKHTVGEQNAQIQSLRDEGVLRSEEAAAELAKVRDSAAAWKEKYRSIFTAPRSDANDCKAVTDRLVRYFKARTEESR